MLGVDTILTSGQEADAYAGRELLYELVKLGEKEAVTVMVGAGVNSGNIVQLAKETTAHAFHMSGKKVLPSGMRYRNERVHMGIEGMSEFEIYRTDAEEVRNLKILHFFGILVTFFDALPMLEYNHQMKHELF